MKKPSCSGEIIDGILLIDKPAGPSSHDVVAKVRRLLGQSRVGHTGTLDPAATGLLVILLGKATRLLPYLNDDKEYEGTITLGISTDTLDAAGVILEKRPVSVGAAAVHAAAAAMIGAQGQTPPMVSAVKIGGQPLYKLARKGIEVERAERRIEIFSFDILGGCLSTPDDSENSEGESSGKARGRRVPVGTRRSRNAAGGRHTGFAAGAEYLDSLIGIGGEPDYGEIEIRVACTKGTYIRVLAVDFGARLGCPAHLSRLRRTGAGDFSIKDSLTLEELEVIAGEGKVASRTISLRDSLPGTAEISVDDDGWKDTVQGRQVLAGRVTSVSGHSRPGDFVKIVAGSGDLIGIAKVLADIQSFDQLPAESGIASPKRVFV